MAFKIALFALNHNDVESVLIRKIKATKDEVYSDLRPQLEKACVLKWPFDFWDAEGNLRIHKQLEPLNDIGDNVHMIRVVSDEIDMSKRRRIGDDDYMFSNSVDIDVVEENPLNVRAAENKLGNPTTKNNLGDPVVSMVSASGEVLGAPLIVHLKSTLLPKEVMVAYLEGKTRLRKNLARIGKKTTSGFLRRGIKEKWLW